MDGSAKMDRSAKMDKDVKLHHKYERKLRHGGGGVRRVKPTRTR